MIRKACIAFVCVALTPALIYVGYRIALSIPDGTEHLVGVDKVAAEDALVKVQVSCFDNPITRIVALRLRVVGVEVYDRILQHGMEGLSPRLGYDSNGAEKSPRLAPWFERRRPASGYANGHAKQQSTAQRPGEGNGSQDAPRPALSGRGFLVAYRARVRAYALFGIPTRTIDVSVGRDMSLLLECYA